MPIPAVVGAAMIGAGVQGLGMLGQRGRERRSMQHQRELMDKQKENQMTLNEQGQRLAMQTWKETSYGPQMEMMKEAGLNPALMYGMSGGGGQTTSSGSGGSASGGQAPAPQPMELDKMMNAAMLAAQIKNINADTAQKEATTDSTRGEEGTIGATQIAKMIAETTNEDEKRGLIKAQKIIEQQEAKYASETKMWESTKAEHEARRTQTEAETAQQTQATDIERTKQELRNAKAEGNIKQQEAIIRKFEADLTKDGISPNSPYYIKIIADLLREVGLMGLLKGEK